jgi:hypothetical protein
MHIDIYFLKLEDFNYDNVKPLKSSFPNYQNYASKHDFLYEPKH